METVLLTSKRKCLKQFILKMVDFGVESAHDSETRGYATHNYICVGEVGLREHNNIAQLTQEYPLHSLSSHILLSSILTLTDNARTILYAGHRANRKTQKSM